MLSIMYPALAVLLAVLVYAFVVRDGKALAVKLADVLLLWGIGICLWVLARQVLRLP